MLELVDLCSRSPRDHCLRKQKQRLVVLFAEELGVGSQTCVSTTAKPCQNPSSMSEGPQPERGVCPKGEPRAVLHLCHQRSSQATHRLVARSAPPLLSDECVGLVRVVTLIPRSVKQACTLSRTQQMAGSLSEWRVTIVYPSEAIQTERDCVTYPPSSPFCVTPEAKIAPCSAAPLSDHAGDLHPLTPAAAPGLSDGVHRLLILVGSSTCP